MSKHKPKHKKHKQNHEQLEKIAKAQAKNEFLRRLKKVLAVIGCEPVYHLLSDRIIDLMFDHRSQAVKVIGADDNTFHSDDLKWFKKALVYYLKNNLMDLDIGGAQIDAYTFMTVGMTLKIFAETIIDKNLVKHPEYHKILRDFQESDTQIRNSIDCLFDTTEYICFLISDLQTRIYWTENSSEKNFERVCMANYVKIHSAAPEKKNFIINREIHTAFRLGWTINSNAEWVSIKPESIGLRPIGNNNLIDVYIQDHALRRIIERNDCVYVQYLWMFLNISVYEMKYYMHKDNCRYMIEFNLFGIKTGYLIAQIVDTRLVIQTFLFLTNDGTPEGQKLQENIGVERSDKEYLKIDLLSTFIAPEVECNERIRKVFKEAGCDSLFKIKAELEKRKIMIRKPVSASLIEDYLMLSENKNEEYEGDAFDENLN